jgi:hypothetical protein
VIACSVRKRSLLEISSPGQQWEGESVALLLSVGSFVLVIGCWSLVTWSRKTRYVAVIFHKKRSPSELNCFIGELFQIPFFVHEAILWKIWKGQKFLRLPFQVSFWNFRTDTL